MPHIGPRLNNLFDVYRHLQVMIGILIIAVAASLCTGVSAANFDANLRVELERLAQRRIFFGHQSVGENLLDGVKQLATKAGVPVRIIETDAASKVGPATFGHTFVAENGNPTHKLQSFNQAMGSQSAGLDIAFMKFCFVDFNVNTDVKELFAHYQATIDDLRTRNPGTTFIHVTAPLTGDQGGFKGFVKRLLGRAPYGIMENIRLEEYNALLRQAYRGREPIFDLARVESTAPDGKVLTAKWQGSVTPTMVPGYTDDGGHLNAAGRLRAARELISVLAAVPDQRAAVDRSIR